MKTLLVVMLALLLSLCMVMAPVAAAPAGEGLLSDQTLLIDLFHRLSPSVIELRSWEVEYDIFAGLTYEAPIVGTGWVWRDNIVVTCQHVVENRNRLKAYIADPDLEPWVTEAAVAMGWSRAKYETRTYQIDNGLAVQVLGEDAKMDVAIVRVPDLPKWAKPLELGDSAGLETGQFILSIGNSLGLFQTMGFGILTYEARTIPDVESADVTGMLQHQSITHPGNSGGPIFDLYGRVIGMCQLGLRGYNIGLSIPVNKVDKLATEQYELWRAYCQVAPWAMGGER